MSGRPNDLPNHYHKPNRLAGYDYAAPGYYFITICSLRHEMVFGRIIPDPDDRDFVKMIPNRSGQAVEWAILEIPRRYPGIIVDKYVVMPNHVHLILAITERSSQVSISRIVQQFKRAVSVQIGKSVWQQGFYDHIIRGEADYQEIWTYIDNNPKKRALDKYYHE